MEGGPSKNFAFGDTPDLNQSSLQEKCQTLENQLENVTTEKDSLARAVTKGLADVVELRTQLVIEEQKHKALLGSATNKEEVFQAQLNERKETIVSLSERLRVAPVLDEAITSLYVEIRMTLQHKMLGPALTKEEKDGLPRTSPLVVLERLRTWVRQLLHKPQPPSATGGATGGSARRGGRSTSSGGVKSDSPERPASPSLSRAETTVLAMLNTSGGGDDPDMLLSELVARLQNENDALQDQVDGFQDALTITKKEAIAVQQQSRTLADLARRDAANAKAECKKKEARIEKLQQELTDRRQSADLQHQLVKTHRTTESTKKDLRNLLDAKKQEIFTLRRQHEDEIRDISARLHHYERQRTESSQLQQELAEQRDRTSSVQAQLTRSNITGLVKEKQRITTLALKQEGKIQVLETKLQGQRGIMHHLDQTNKKMTEQYNVIFEAHVRERELEQSRRSKVRHAAITKATVGPDAEMTVAHYRERYYEVLEELKRSQGKMKQLLLFAQHDHIAYAKHTAATEADLAEVEAERDQLHLRTSNLVNALHSMQNSGLSNTTTGGGGGIGESGPTMRSEDEHYALMFGEKEDASTTLTDPSVRLAPTHTMIDVSVPSIGVIRTPFGGPLDESEILRLRTEVPNHHQESPETSLRALNELSSHRDAPQGTKQEVLSRRPQKKIPGVGSTRGKKFDFASVGRSHFNTSAIASMVRPKSANPDLSY